MWLQLMSYTTVINAILYFLIGLITSILHARKLWRMTLVNVFTTIAGATIAFFLSAPPSLILAAIYSSLHTSMSDIDAITLGCCQGLVVAMLSAGVFHRIL